MDSLMSWAGSVDVTIMMFAGNSFCLFHVFDVKEWLMQLKLTGGGMTL